MKNRYEIRDDITVIFIESKKYGLIETKISTAKLDKAKELTGSWYVHFNKLAESFYVQGSIAGGKTTQLHRWIYNSAQGMFIDHINHDTLDNTDPNLRNATPSENSQNRKMQKNNSSGVRGVYMNRGKWVAAYRLNGKHHQIGRFENIEDAESAIKDARRRHMPFSPEASI